MSDKYPFEIRQEAIMKMKEGMRDTQISKILGISTNTLRRWRRDESLPLSNNKISKEVIEEAIMKMKEGTTDTQISKMLGISTTTLRRIRKENGIKPSSGNRIYSNRDWNDVIDLIRDGYIIGEITRKTGISAKRIYQFWEEERRNGNILPEIKKGQARKQKYSDEELIELAYMNPGYGFRRFIDYLKVSENFVMGLFLEYKDFTNNEEDLLNILQDERLLEMVTESKYREITGRKYIPQGHSKRGALARKDDLSRKTKLFLVPLPPQIFNWGKIREK